LNFRFRKGRPSGLKPAHFVLGLCGGTEVPPLRVGLAVTLVPTGRVGLALKRWSRPYALLGLARSSYAAREAEG